MQKKSVIKKYPFYRIFELIVYKLNNCAILSFFFFLIYVNISIVWNYGYLRNFSRVILCYSGYVIFSYKCYNFIIKMSLRE